jgi:hypothetical protein
MVTDNNM